MGDLVQITKLTIEGDKILFEINGGMKGKGSWKDHIQIGMGGTTSPISTGQNSNAPGGTNIALRFNQPIPPVKAADIKKMLAPVLDFEKETATENYVEKLPEPIQNAIKANKAIEGKITFVTFANSKVIRIKEAYADIGGSTAPSLPVK